MEETIFTIEENFEGERIDKYLTKIFTDQSRSYLQGLIEKGNVLVNDNPVKANYLLEAEDIIKVTIPDPVTIDIKAENIPLDIYYEDEDVIVVNKPSGMVVHPAIGNYSGTLVNALMYHCKDLSGINGELKAGIVHRIDAYTTGLLMVAKNNKTHEFLSKQLEEKTTKRK